MSQTHYNGGIGYDWNSAVVKTALSVPLNCGGYGGPVCKDAMDKYVELIRDKIGLVIGSE